MKYQNKYKILKKTNGIWNVNKRKIENNCKTNEIPT